MRWATRRADGVAAASEAIARAVGAPGAAVLRPGVDLERFAAAPAPNGAPRALALAALVPWKRPDLALEVAARVPGLQLELAGAPIPGDDGAYVRALEARAAAGDLAGRVTFLGPVGDPREALARAHCLLHCSDAEPWGLALVEALAAGRPVVAADAGGPREIVAGGAGRLFPPGRRGGGRRRAPGGARRPRRARRRRAPAPSRFPVEASAARFEAALEEIRVSFSAIVVLHDSEPELRVAARLARAPPRRAAPARGGRHRLGRRRRRRSPASAAPR